MAYSRPILEPSLVWIRTLILLESCLQTSWKVLFLAQVERPLTFVLGRIVPKTNQFIYMSCSIPELSLVKIRPAVLLESCYRDLRCSTDGRTDGRTIRKHNASGTLRVGGIIKTLFSLSWWLFCAECANKWSDQFLGHPI